MTHGRAGLGVLLVLVVAAEAAAWGAAGHALVARAAVAAAPDLPPWFRTEAAALADLANAPDRWREAEDRVPALAGRRADHFFDLDVWGGGRLPSDRWQYAARAARRGLQPEDVGFLPWAILEEQGVLLVALRDARDDRPGARAAAIAAAGVLAHLVGDAAVPLHATRHHHGWVGSNPRGFTRARTIHHWFETAMVDRVDPVEIVASVEPPPDDVAAAVHALIADSLASVPRLYEAERRFARDGDAEAVLALVRERLRLGASALARLWRAAAAPR
jgi:hypothetical protein